MKRVLFSFLFIFSVILEVLAQCPTSDFSIRSTACIDEQIDIENLSLNATSYKWDFCANDNLEEIPVSQQINGDFGASLNSKTILTSGEYISFVPGWTTHNLFRLDFGSTITSSPTYNDLGNIGNGIQNICSIDLFNENGIWYGLSTGYANNALYLLTFGSSLKNTPTVDDIGASLGLNLPMDVIIQEEGNNLYAFIVNNAGSSIHLLNFGNSILNDPTAQLINIAGSNQLSSIVVGIECDQKYGFITSRGNGKIFRLVFGNSITNTPIIDELSASSGIILDNPGSLDIASEGELNYLIISSRNGDLYRFNLGSSLANSPVGVNLTNINSASKDWGVELIKENSVWYMLQANFNGRIYRYQFGIECNIPIVESTIFEPINITYPQSGTYTISLNAVDAQGNISRSVKSITITSSQAPQLLTQINGNCLTNPISFTGQQLSGNITNWNWDFGDDSGTSTLQNDTYTYASAGTYQVKLNVTDANGCNNLVIDTVQVYEEPIPDFTFPAGTLCMNNPVTFANTTTGETGPAVTWTWDFNGQGTSVVKDPSFTFLTSGNKTITLTSSIPGCANVTQQTIFIEEAPTTAFSFNNVCNTQTTTFTDLTIGNNLTSWSWDFGDGNFSTDQNPTHTYTSPGKYPVTLTVDNNLGCSTSISDTVYNHAAPVVNFTNDLPCSSSPIQFSDQSIVQDAGIVVWEWDFGDGNISTERNPQHTYGQTGDFTVQLKAYSQFGCVDSTESIITVIQGPEADFDWDKGCLGETTSFTDITNSFGQPITSWTWLIDNTVFTLQNPQYTFSTSGTFTVQLSVTTNNLCAQTISKEIVVEATPLTSFDYSESCTSNTVTFFDTTPPTIAMRQWRIESTMNSTDSLMSEILLPGNYMVSLATTSTSGCNGALTKSINIVGSPVAQYTVSTDYGAAPLTVQFNNESTGSETYFWDFGDANNSSSTEINPQFIFTDIGTYNVTLIATGGQNCADTLIQIIEAVEVVHGLSLDAITPLDGGSIALTLSNMGSYTYNEDNLQLVFTLDIGAEISEPFATVLYPQKTINYMPNITLGDVRNSKVLCAELQFIDTAPSAILDKNCLNLNSQAIITDAYPNPANDYINLSVVLPQSGNVSITLIDRTGAVIINDTFESSQQGLNNYTIDTTPYRSGLYIIKIETDSEVKKMKVVIDK